MLEGAALGCLLIFGALATWYAVTRTEAYVAGLVRRFGQGAATGVLAAVAALAFPLLGALPAVLLPVIASNSRKFCELGAQVIRYAGGAGFILWSSALVYAHLAGTLVIGNIGDEARHTGRAEENRQKSVAGTEPVSPNGRDGDYLGRDQPTLPGGLDLGFWPPSTSTRGTTAGREDPFMSGQRGSGSGNRLGEFPWTWPPWVTGGPSIPRRAPLEPPPPSTTDDRFPGSLSPWPAPRPISPPSIGPLGPPGLPPRIDQGPTSPGAPFPRPGSLPTSPPPSPLSPPRLERYRRAIQPSGGVAPSTPWRAGLGALNSRPLNRAPRVNAGGHLQAGVNQTVEHGPLTASRTGYADVRNPRSVPHGNAERAVSIGTGAPPGGFLCGVRQTESPSWQLYEIKDWDVCEAVQLSSSHEGAPAEPANHNRARCEQNKLFAGESGFTVLPPPRAAS